MTGKLGSKTANKQNSTAAVYAHWRGVQQQLNEQPGFITVHLAADGWFWMIPLPDGVMSVGFVGNADVFKTRHGTAQDLYLDRLNRSPTVGCAYARRRADHRHHCHRQTIPTVPPPLLAKGGWPWATPTPFWTRCSPPGSCWR